jgi:hypothetical protein
MNSKLNLLMRQWPRGAVVTSGWLERHGVYPQLAARYVASGWIESLGRGAFFRAGEQIDWLGGVYALQNHLGLKVHVGGETALSMKGLGQYLPLGNNPEGVLFSERKERLPSWFRRHDWSARVRHYSPALLAKSNPDSFLDMAHGDFTVRVAAPELAILEVLDLATTNSAVSHAVDLVSNLATLRPKVVQSLLESCSSVKVKRLFLWAAETAGHEWFGRLSPNRIELGKGKRAIYSGGQFDSKYMITIPKGEIAHV